jgi:hypothetical protein
VSKQKLNKPLQAQSLNNSFEDQSLCNSDHLNLAQSRKSKITDEKIKRSARRNETKIEQTSSKSFKLNLFIVSTDYFSILKANDLLISFICSNNSKSIKFSPNWSNECGQMIISKQT